MSDEWERLRIAYDRVAADGHVADPLASRYRATPAAVKQDALSPAKE